MFGSLDDPQKILNEEHFSQESKMNSKESYTDIDFNGLF